MAMRGAKIDRPSLDWIPLTEQIVVETPQYRRGWKVIERAHRESLKRREPVGEKIWGPIGVGKSVLAEQYEQQFLPRQRVNGVLQLEVLRGVVPDKPTRRSFIAELLRKTGDLAWNSEKSGDKLGDRLKDILKLIGTRLILIDEFQHLVQGANQNVAPEVANWLKHFHYDYKISIVCFGTPIAEKVFKYERQLAERFAANVTIEPFRFDTLKEKKLFAAFLKEMDERQPFAYIGLSNPVMAFRMYCATRGYKRRVSRILTGAVEAAVEAYPRTRRRHLVMSDFATAFDRWIQTYSEDAGDDQRPTSNPFRRGELPKAA
jgi:predicted AAA+ superfamily ATPase